MNSPAKLFVLGLVATVCSPTLPAGTLDWVGGPSGRLLDGLNWSPEAVPTSADTLRFADVGEVAVTSDADAAPSGMSISNGDVAFDMGGHSLSFANGFNLSATAAYICQGPRRRACSQMATTR